MHFSKTGQCLKHLNEESLSVTSFCVCVCVCLMRCKMTYVVYNFDAENCTSCLLCSEFYLWFCSELACALIHMYSCMICPYQLYHCKLILICNSICHYFTKLACGEAPKYHFLCHSLWSFSLHNNVCVCLWCGLLLLNTLISLHERCSKSVSNTCTWPFLPTTTADLL